MNATSSHWVNAAETASRLQAEASSSASHLGHKMSSWVNAPGEKRLYLSRCISCNEVARVSVRNPHRGPITGAAVELSCVPRTKKPASPPPSPPVP